MCRASRLNPQRANKPVLSNTRNFGPNKVNEARIAFLRLAVDQLVPEGGLGDIASFGFPKAPLGLIPDPFREGVPTIGLNNMGVNFGLPNCQAAQFNNTYQASDNFSMVRGRHTLKFGGEIRQLHSTCEAVP